jgi:hypothetical protein
MIDRKVKQLRQCGFVGDVKVHSDLTVSRFQVELPPRKLGGKVLYKCVYSSTV